MNKSDAFFYIIFVSILMLLVGFTLGGILATISFNEKTNCLELNLGKETCNKIFNKKE